MRFFYADTGDDLDWMETTITDENTANNKGLYYRFEKTKHSQTFENWGRIHSELFNQSKLLPGGNELRVKLQRNDPSFSLMCKTNDNDFIISTDTAILMVRHCQISPHIIESHTKALQTRNLKFPINKVEVKFFTKGSGRSDLSEPNLVTGVLPIRVIIGLVRSDAFNGDKTKNPFNFQHFNASSIILRKNGNAIPLEEIDLDFENNCYLQGYMSLVQATGKLFQDQGFSITPEQYKNGYVLYGFDLTPDLTPCNSFNLLQEGTLSLEIKLKSNTNVSVTTVVYLEYQNLLEIDSEGNIINE